MNRDESRKRVPGRPPSRKRALRRTYLAPAEPTGGTWIAVNDRGVGLTLINWYAVKRQPSQRSVSRGRIIQLHAGAAEPGAVSVALKGMPLNRMRPFRLIGFFPDSKTVVEWRWDLARLTQRTHRWLAQQWISSGFDEPGAQRTRGKTFREARRQKTFGTSAWLRRLHRSHAPERGAFSTCMHRDDAITVSYAEVTVSASRATMRYAPGPPCEAQRKKRGPVVKHLPLAHPS